MKVFAILALAATASAQDSAHEGNQCHLEYFHSSHAAPVDLTGTLCSAWSDNACCSQQTANKHVYAATCTGTAIDTVATPDCAAAFAAAQSTTHPVDAEGRAPTSHGPGGPGTAPDSCPTGCTYTTTYEPYLMYGDGFNYAKCGAVSHACARWFMAESCLYECDVNAGRYRHHVGDASCAEGANRWQISGMPLKVSISPQRLPPSSF